MGFSTVPCNEFVEVLGSKAPVPGGGGASALVGAVGTALGNKDGALTADSYTHLTITTISLQIRYTLSENQSKNEK